MAEVVEAAMADEVLLVMEVIMEDFAASEAEDSTESGLLLPQSMAWH